MKTLITLILFTAAALPAQELKQGEIKRDRQKFAQIITTKGETFKDVEVSKVTPIDIRIMHTGGFATLPLAELPADVQQLFGYNAQDADAAMKDAQAQRQQDLVKAEQDKAAHAALLQRQHMESKAIKQIEAKGFDVELLCEQKLADGCLCRMWELKQEAIADKKNFSGQAMTRTVLGREYSVFIAGLDLAAGARQQTRVFPCTAKVNQRQAYTRSATVAYRLEAEEAEKIAAAKAAKQAEYEARRQAMQAASAAARAARESAKETAAK